MIKAFSLPRFEEDENLESEAENDDAMCLHCKDLRDESSQMKNIGDGLIYITHHNQIEIYLCGLMVQPLWFQSPFRFRQTFYKNTIRGSFCINNIISKKTRPITAAYGLCSDQW